MNLMVITTNTVVCCSGHKGKGGRELNTNVLLQGREGGACYVGNNVSSICMNVLTTP